LASGGGAKFDLAELLTEGVVEFDFGNKGVGADLGIVGFATTDIVGWA
jgi:hypothetical protein